MNKKEIFGKRFKEIRKKFGYTQDKMAEIAGIEPQSISKIESGKNFPLLSNLEKIASNLGIELEDFFCYEHKDTNLKENLINIFETLEQSDKEKLLRIARALKV
ncbi:helix-turn-helix transcriptional regulator [bacterium]|nr:helix-turn-helix transcriptional regulator [bacterium]